MEEPKERSERQEKRFNIIRLISELMSYLGNLSNRSNRSDQWHSFLYQLPRMIRQRASDNRVVEWLKMIIDLTKEGYLFGATSNNVDITFAYDGIIELKGGLYTYRQTDGVSCQTFRKHLDLEVQDCDPVTQFKNIIKKRKYGFSLNRPVQRIGNRDELMSKAECVYLGAIKDLLYDCKHWSNIPESLASFNQRYDTNFTIEDVSAIRGYEAMKAVIQKVVSDMNDRREALEEYKEDKRTAKI